MHLYFDRICPSHKVNFNKGFLPNVNYFLAINLACWLLIMITFIVYPTRVKFPTENPAGSIWNLNFYENHPTTYCWKRTEEKTSSNFNIFAVTSRLQLVKVAVGWLELKSGGKGRTGSLNYNATKWTKSLIFCESDEAKIWKVSFNPWRVENYYIYYYYYLITVYFQPVA